VCKSAALKLYNTLLISRILTSLLNDENLLIINKTKHSTKGEKMVQDGRTHFLANKESSNEGGS